MSPRETTTKSQCTMEDERPRPALQRSFSARLPTQHDHSRQHSSKDYRDCYLQMQPDGSTRSFAIPIANAVSFDEGVAAYAPPRTVYESDEIFHFDPEFEDHHGRPLRAPRRYVSLHPGQALYHPTTPYMHPESIHHYYGDQRPTLQRRNSGYMRTNHLGGVRSGAFPREGDRLHSKKQLFRRPSLSTISPDPQGFSSLGRSKKASKKSIGRHKQQYAEIEEGDSGYWSRSDPKPFQPKRSNSIYRRFDKNKKLDQNIDDDVWVERLILTGQDGVKKTCFKSLRGNETRSEPPTGASTIVYLEDIIVDKNGNPSRVRPVQNKKEKAKKKKKKKESPKQDEPELKVEEISPQPKDDALTEVENSETSNSSAATEVEGTGKKTRPKGLLLKRRASIFGFMKKKNRKNKNAPAKE